MRVFLIYTATVLLAVVFMAALIASCLWLGIHPPWTGVVCGPLMVAFIMLVGHYLVRRSG